MWIALAALGLAVLAIPVLTFVMPVALDVVDLVTSEVGRVWRSRAWAPRVVRENWPGLRKEGDGIVAAIEAYRESTGSYPQTLVDLEDRLPGWSDWRYEVDDAGEAHLQIGEYDLHMFEITWSSTNGWYVDT